MKHLPVDLYQGCSYDAPGVKTGLAPVGHIFETQEQRGKTSEFFFSETRKGRALIFGYEASPSGFLPRLFI